MIKGKSNFNRPKDMMKFFANIQISKKPKTISNLTETAQQEVD